MKRVVLTVLLCTGIAFASLAQRFAYVDTKYILKHIPEYISSQKQLDALSVQWQKEIDTRMAEVDKLYKTYQADQVLLNDEMRRRREGEIVDKERAAKDFQNQKFGVNGDLFKEQERLIKPIQERVSKAVQAVMETRQLDMMFDKSSEAAGILFASPSLDRSNEVIVKLGYKPGSAPEGGN